jgi:putative PIN family toxin of toxin-antitoxin system
MKVILDTNVFVSGVYFSGPPHTILQAWRDGLVHIVISREIFDEYARVGDLLGKRYLGIDLKPILQLLAVEAEIVEAPEIPVRICDDPSDDKFFSCAITSGAHFIISGDNHLLRASGYRNVEVIKPRQFVDNYLKKGNV